MRLDEIRSSKSPRLSSGMTPSRAEASEQEAALPVLVGVAIATALEEIGYAGRWFSDRVAADADRRKEIRSAAIERSLKRREEATMDSEQAQRRREEAVIAAQKRLRKQPPEPKQPPDR
jgi:hypothetical protein